ncbi:MAG: histidine kinase, partial [Mesorhizobium sp.]
DSIFVDGNYIVKGVAGALLRLMLEWHLGEGRSEFTNREMRLVAGARMPEIKDNLETRLLLLRRRLEEKQAPIKIVRIGRGRVRLETEGPL